ncbi:hypothetical protein [Sorangium sp. So ce406]|uniref:hypothetical protein n=1 Tax=Sorangium sp. So ce406 TaxID=3133311 RepID=UPI003F5C20FD
MIHASTPTTPAAPSGAMLGEGRVSVAPSRAERPPSRIPPRPMLPLRQLAR